MTTVKINVGTLGKEDFTNVEAISRGKRASLLSIEDVETLIGKTGVAKIEYHTSKVTKTKSSLNATSVYRLVGLIDGFHVGVIINKVRFMLIAHKVPAQLKHLSWKSNVGDEIIADTSTDNTEPETQV